MTACAHCSKDFAAARPHQKFCSPKCRIAAHGDGGLRGAVSSVRVLKRGHVSVVLRFSPTDRDNALRLTPGTLVEVHS